jgi:hypothetical protein
MDPHAKSFSAVSFMLVPIPYRSQAAAAASFPAISTVSQLSGKQVHHAANSCFTVRQQTVPCKQ